METFDFCPDRNIPETLPRETSNSSMSMNGWNFSARPTTPYQRKFKISLQGVRWYLDPVTGLYDPLANPKFNAHALEKFYARHETWNPFIFKHQHIGDLVVRFASPLIVPAAKANSGGLIDPIEMMLLHHNPGFS
jgi:hypothetical protein